MVNRNINESQDCCLIKLFQHIKTEDKDEVRYFTSFYVKEYSEFIKFFHFCKENQIEFCLNEYGHEIEEDYQKRYGEELFFYDGMIIEDIYITLPTEFDIMCINIVF